MDDKGNKIKEATPGTAVHVSGFKSLPEVGHPMYVVRDKHEADFIISHVKQKREEKENIEKGVDFDKKMGKLTRLERRILYSGDQSILKERLGIIEIEDINHLQRKLGIKENLVALSIEEVEEKLEPHYKSSSKTRMKRLKHKIEVDELFKMVK